MDKQSQEEGLNGSGENPEVPPLLNEDDAAELPPILKEQASKPSPESVASQVPDASEPETPVPRSNSPVAEPVTASVPFSHPFSFGLGLAFTLQSAGALAWCV